MVAFRLWIEGSKIALPCLLDSCLTHHSEDPDNLIWLTSVCILHSLVHRIRKSYGLSRKSQCAISRTVALGAKMNMVARFERPFREFQYSRSLIWRLFPSPGPVP